MKLNYPIALPDSDHHEWPRILQCDRNELRAELSIFVPQSTHWFTGHFVGQPVLPGVVQVFWAEYFTRSLYTVPKGPFQIKKLKFQAMILPDTRLLLTIENRTEKNEWWFSYSNDDDLRHINHSSGIFAPLDPEH